MLFHMTESEIKKQNTIYASSLQLFGIIHVYTLDLDTDLCYYQPFVQISVTKSE